MNLIEFIVTEIIEEKSGFLYELFDMTEEEARASGYKWLFHQGCAQSCKTRDMGGEQIEHFIHDLDEGEYPYEVGSKGLH